MFVVIVICLCGYDMAVYNKKYIYLIFDPSPDTKLLKPLEFPVISEIKCLLLC